jgi:hypothetical protein
LKFVTNKEWLVENLENEEIKVVDCRFDLSEPNTE